jgi:hypothetical protein
MSGIKRQGQAWPMAPWQCLYSTSVLKEKQKQLFNFEF